MPRMLTMRAGVTTAEFVVAMTLLSVLATALTSVFVTQSRFFDTQTQVSLARGVWTRAANTRSRAWASRLAQIPNAWVDNWVAW